MIASTITPIKRLKDYLSGRFTGFNDQPQAIIQNLDDSQVEFENDTSDEQVIELDKAPLNKHCIDCKEQIRAMQQAMREMNAKIDHLKN